MSERVPSPELVRFLVTNWQFSAMTIGHVQAQLPTLANSQWHGFDKKQIEKDLQTAINHRSTNAVVKEFAKPVVLCLFDDGQQGKTTFANLLIHNGLPVFPTDRFVAGLKNNWHGDQQLCGLANLHVPSTVDQFIMKVQADKNLGTSFVELFFDKTNGFNQIAPVSVIEGFLRHPNHAPVIALDDAVKAGLRKRGYKVWVATKIR